MRIVSVGHAVFAAAMIGLGIFGLIRGDFEGVWGGVPEHLQGREALPYLCGAVALGCGLGLLFTRTAAFASRALLIFLLLWILAFKVRFIVEGPLEEGSYQTNGENAAIIAGAWVLYTWLATEWDKKRLGFAAGDNGVRIARLFYAFAMFAFGFSHFVYVNLTTPLIPTWLPGTPTFWAYFTGGAYLAAGLAILTGVWARLAAALSTAQMGGFLLLIWIPMLAAGPVDAFRWGEVMATCVLTASAWVVTESYRGAPWFGVTRWRAPA